MPLGGIEIERAAAAYAESDQNYNRMEDGATTSTTTASPSGRSSPGVAAAAAAPGAPVGGVNRSPVSPYRPVNMYPAQVYLREHPPAVAAIPVASPAYSNENSNISTFGGTYVAPPSTTHQLEAGMTGGQQHPPPTATDQPAALIENAEFCTTSCFGTFCRWMGSYLIMITIAAIITAMFLPQLGLFMLSILPAITLLSFLETRFRKSVIKMQMLITFFEAVAWMIPIVILESLTNYFLIVRTHLPSEGYCPTCILSDFLQAYLIAGLFEESVKYLAVRRIIYKSYVVDPRAMIVYSCCAAAAFGTVEDVIYNMNYGLVTAIVRALTSVPLHCATGLIIGTSLATRRFFQQDTERWYKTLILPVFIHGTYDFVTFMLPEGYLAIVGFVIGVLIVVLSYVYIRKRILFLMKAFPNEVDVHVMLMNGEIEAPGVCCCAPTACPSCYF